MDTHLYITLVILHRWTTAPTRRGQIVIPRKNTIKYTINNTKHTKTSKLTKPKKNINKPQKKMPTNHRARMRSRGV